MRKAPQEIFPKAGARRGWIWNNDAILCPCLGCNEPEDWWGHSCYRMVLEGFLRALGRITEKKKFRARQVRGSSWPQQSTEWGGGCSLKQLSSAVLTVFVCFTPERVHPERTWPAGENNRKQLAVSAASRCCFLGAFSLSFFFFLTAGQVTCSWILQLDSAMVLSVSPWPCAHVLEGLFVKEIWKGEQIGDEVLTFLHKDDLFPSPSSSPELLPRRMKEEMLAPCPWFTQRADPCCLSRVSCPRKHTLVSYTKFPCGTKVAGPLWKQIFSKECQPNRQEDKQPTLQGEVYLAISWAGWTLKPPSLYCVIL